MEQWLQAIDVVEIQTRECRATQTSRRERHAKAIQKLTTSQNPKENAKIYVYKRFACEKGCCGGCGRDVLKSSFIPNWNNGEWKRVGSMEKNDELFYDVVVNSETMCCSGFEHYDNFRTLEKSNTPNYDGIFGYRAKRIHTLIMTYQDALALQSSKR